VAKRLVGTAVILTALAVEYKAVCKHLVELKEQTYFGTIYEHGWFDGEHGRWEVWVLEIGAGNIAAAQQAERAFTVARPQVAFFVGVAGGLKHDVKLGDVVAADKVYLYHAGKDGEEFQPRANAARCSHPLEQRARAEARKERWRERLDTKPRGRQPQAVVKPIAAGEQVVASSDSATATFLRKHYSDAVAVEMEGRGFLEAAYGRDGAVQALVIRGISDHLDGKARADAHGGQERAARHASAFAFEILAHHEPVQDTGYRRLFASIREHRLQPKQLLQTWAPIEAALNPEESALDITVLRDAVILRPRVSPAGIPYRMHLGLGLRLPGGELLEDVLRRAMDSDGTVVVEGARIQGAEIVCGHEQVGLGEMFPDLLDRPATLTVSVEPLTPPVLCYLIVPETGIRLDYLEIEAFLRSDGSLLLTNRRQTTHCALVSVEFHAGWQVALQAATRGVGAEDIGEGIDLTGTFSIDCRYFEGRSARDMIAFHRMREALQEPRAFALVAAGNETARLPLQGSLDANWTPLTPLFIDALDTLQGHYPGVVFPFPEHISRADVEEVVHLSRLMKTGQEEGTWRDPSFDIEAIHIPHILRAADSEKFIFVSSSESKKRVLGVEIDLGESMLLPFSPAGSKTKTLKRAQATPAGGTCPLVLRSKIPDGVTVLRRFKRFWPEPDTFLQWSPRDLSPG